MLAADFNCDHVLITWQQGDKDALDNYNDAKVSLRVVSRCSDLEVFRYLILLVCILLLMINCNVVYCPWYYHSCRPQIPGLSCSRLLVYDEDSHSAGISERQFFQGIGIFGFWFYSVYLRKWVASTTTIREAASMVLPW